MTTTAAASSKASVGKRVRRVLLTILSLYLLFVLLVMFCQRRLLYFPTQLQEKVAEQIASREKLVPWRNNFGKIIGWKLPATESATASVLIVHGNAGCALDRGYFAEPIHNAATVDVYLLEYPGYGARDGSPSQQNFLAAAEEAFDLLTNKVPIFVVSESLGTGVAAHLAKTRDVAGLMLFAPFNSMVSLAQQKMPILPVGLILWDRYNPESWLKNYNGPIGFVLAERDEVIPSKFGQRLHDGYSGPKTLRIISGAGHNEISSQLPEWWKKVFSFWEEHKQHRRISAE